MEDECFEICSVANFTYKQLIDNIGECLAEVKSICKQVYAKDHQPDQHTFDELRKYMCEFLMEVEDDYKRNNK
jgi:hypothetical protein